MYQDHMVDCQGASSLCVVVEWPPVFLLWSQTHTLANLVSNTFSNSQLNPHTLINLSGQTHSATTLNWMMSKEKQGRVGKSKRFCIKMWNCIFSRKHPLFSALKCTDRYTFIGMPCWSWAELILPPSRFLSTVQFSLDSFVRRIFHRRFHFNLSTALPSAPCRWPGGWVGGLVQWSIFCFERPLITSQTCSRCWWKLVSGKRLFEEEELQGDGVYSLPTLLVHCTEWKLNFFQTSCALASIGVQTSSW